MQSKNLNSLTRFFQRILPAIQLHIWGGLGSQLYGISKFHELQANLHFRKIAIYFHSSGITKRLPEITKLLPPENDFFFINDFDDPAQSSISLRSNELILKNRNSQYFRKIAKKLRIIMSLNDWGQFPRLWTLQIRGHYRNQDIPQYIIEQILNGAIVANLIKIDQPSENYLAIHYRLDDLVNLKKTVDADLLTHQILKIIDQYSLGKIILLSDSFDLAKQRLHRISISNSELFSNPWTAINLGINSKVFVGTNSKLSYWIVLFRLIMDSNSVNFLPKSNELEFRISRYASSKNLFFYKDFEK